MASTISYNMGQIRYSDPYSKYMNDLNFTPHSVITPSLSSTINYQDIVLYGDLNNPFSLNESYYLRLGIPRNLSFNMTFDLKLLRGLNPENFYFVNRNQYQEVKRFVVPRDSSGSLSFSRVILYPIGGIDKEAEPIAVVVKDSRSETQNNGVYYKDGNYYIKKSDGNDVEILYRNDILLNHTWKDNESDDLVYFDFVFSNKVSGEAFNSILIELNRNSYDDDVSYEGEDGQQYKGLYIDPTKVDVQCYRLVNMVNNINFGTNDISSFNNIGVWSHADSIMAINGEEIRVGQSGYYELNDFDITNFCMVVKSAKDRFSLDYQYKTS